MTVKTAQGALIDTRGLRCPLAGLKVRKHMRGFPAGTEVPVLATDPGAEQDSPGLLRSHRGHVHVRRVP